MGSTLIFQFLYINVLNYRYFYGDYSTFLKIKKTLKTRFIEKEKRLLQLCCIAFVGSRPTFCVMLIFSVSLYLAVCVCSAGGVEPR